MSKTNSLRLKLNRLDQLGFDTTPVRKSLNADRVAGRLTDAIVARHERKADQVIRALDPGVVGANDFVAQRHGAFTARPKRRVKAGKGGATLASLVGFPSDEALRAAVAALPLRRT